jgi:hypothetical protein
MHGRLAGVQGHSDLSVGPAAIAFANIGFEEDSGMEQLRRRRSPGGDQGRYMLAFFLGEPDHVFGHLRSPLGVLYEQEN